VSVKAKMHENLGLAFVIWQDSPTTFDRIWGYLSHEFLLGSIKVSIVSLITGILIFAIALLLSRSIGTFLDRKIAKRAHIDAGLRFTIVRLVSYLIITIGVISALTQALGVNLTSIAVVFTALSVGIGFGLQSIAADIASGFILLFERPIRVGDRITIEHDEGDVQSIKLRTTVVTTNDRIAIIVPNSRLVSQRVINWSYGDPRARISIPVNVAPDSDVELVTKSLLDAASGVEKVLEDPEPKVQFLKFGDYSLDFRLLVWTREPSRHPQIRSDINYRIAQLFRERHIETSRPVHELRIRQDRINLQEPALEDEREVEREDGN
jgi:potassium-dependent mechanosensitive channel